MEKMNLINMKHNSIVSFLKSIISFLAELFPLWFLSEDETVLSPKTKRPDPAQYFFPVMVSVFLGFTGQWNTAGAQECDPIFRNCPGDIVVNVQPGSCGNNVTWVPPVMTAPCSGHIVTSNHAPGDFFNAGTTGIVYYSWEGTEKKDSCKFNVIVIDNQKPVVLTKNADLYIGQSGSAILRTSDVDNGSYDNCTLILVLSRTVFTCSDVGQTIPVTLRGTDPSGNSSVSGALVTVHDTIRPVIQTRDFTLTLDNNGTGTLQASDIDNGTYDNCGPVALSVTPSVFSCSDQGVRSVRFTATDIHGNTSSKDVMISVKPSLKIHSISLSNCDAMGAHILFGSNVTGGNGNYYYFWDCPDGAKSLFLEPKASPPYIFIVDNSNIPEPIFNNEIADGIYRIRLTVTDGNGCRDSAEMQIIKSGTVYSNVNYRKSIACEGSVVTCTVNPDPVGNAIFQWQVENGAILSSPPYTNSVDVQWNLGVTWGVVTATLSKTNMMGEPCAATLIDSVSIDLIQAPVFNNPVNTVCLESEAVYTLTTPYQIYEWSVTGGIITDGGSGNNFVRVRWNEAPSGKVSVIVSTPAGCSASAYVDVSINNLEGDLISVTDITCNGAANGMVTVAAAEGSGMAPYEYSLDGGVYHSSGSFVNIGPGSHTVTIRDAHSCTCDVGFNITQPVILVAAVNKSDANCFGGFEGTVTAVGSGGTPPYEYSLNSSPFQVSGSFSGLSAGFYTLQTRDANLCTFVQKVHIMQPDAVSGSAEITSPVQCHGGTATVIVTGSGGTAPLTYTFNGVTNGSGIFSGIPAGSAYNWSITDAHGCGPFTGVLEVTEPPVLSGSASVSSEILCYGGTATVTVTGSGGTAPLTYTFNGVSNESGIFSDISAGSAYSWSITDAHGCGPVTGTLEVTEPAVIIGSAMVLVPVECNGGTATVRLSGGGGTVPLIYTFDGISNESGIFNGIHAGSAYTWSISDAHGCGPVTGTLEVTEPAVISGSAMVLVPVECNGGTATVRLTGGGGTAPLIYTFNGDSNDNGIFSGISAGSAYIWSISDANNCNPVTGTLDVTEPEAISGSAVITDPIICHGGTATVTVSGSGGTAPLTYTFNGVSNSTGVFPGISADYYAWSVTDAHGCGPFTGMLEVSEPPVFSGSASVSSEILCYGGTATVTVTGSGGTAPLTYTFNGVSNESGIFSGISAGSAYSWSITDAHGCDPVTGTLEVTEPAVIIGSAMVLVPVECNGGTATVRLSGGGGTVPLIYTFDGISNESGIFNGIHAGSAYTWSISDAHGCGPVTGTLEVTEPAVISGSAMVLVPVECNGGTATVRLTGGGGTAPLTYTFNGDSNDNGIFSGISAGSAYIWSISDAHGCGPVTGTLDVAEPPLLAGSASVSSEILCYGGTATVTVTGSGGTAPLTYTFNGVTNDNGIFNDIPAGSAYSWSITDAHGCGPVTGTLEVTEPAVIIGSAMVLVPVECNGGTATVRLSGGGGTAPLIYTFNGISNDNGIFSGIPAGTGYIWSISDANNCNPVTGTIDVTEPEAISGSATITEPITCYGGRTTVILTGSGGTGPLTYTFNGISNGTGIFAEISAGSDYYWHITDINSCIPVTGTLDIMQPPEYSAEITFLSNVSVSGGNDGSVTVEASGGTAPYLFRLNSGSYQSSGLFSNLAAGHYVVTVQDAALCEIVLPVRITEPVVPLSGILVLKEDILCFGAATGSLSVTGTDGLQPYEYSLNGGDYQSSGIFTGLSAGSYIVTIRDAQPEEYYITVFLDEPATAVTVYTEVINNICHGDAQGSATAIAEGGTGPYGFSWNSSPLQENETASGLTAGSYIVTVTDANGCRVTAEAVLTDPPPLSLSVVTTDANCPDTDEGSVGIIVSGGNSPYNALWEDGNTLFTRTEMLPGTYRFIVTDADGCIAAADVVISYSGTFGCLEIPQIITPNNDGYNDEWRIRNIEMYPDAEVLVYTRWGKLVYRSRNISADPWDGRFNGRLMPTDSYHYILYLNDGSRPRTGVISIIR